MYVFVKLVIKSEIEFGHDTPVSHTHTQIVITKNM